MAASGALATADGRRAAARQMLADPRGQRRVQQFHAFWLAYDQLPLAPEMAGPMRAETDALVARVVFERKGDYFDLFRSTETFVTDALATHYGLPAPGSTSGAWVSYGASPRRGILSHGTLLAAGAKFDDTSPTLRGVFVRNRLFCQTIPPPPPTVAVDEPPPVTSSPCKVDRYAEHRSGGCATCHNQTDPIGFGLENYDRTGRLPHRRQGQPAVRDQRRRRGRRRRQVQRPRRAGRAGDRQRRAGGVRGAAGVPHGAGAARERRRPRDAARG